MPQYHTATTTGYSSTQCHGSDCKPVFTFKPEPWYQLAVQVSIDNSHKIDGTATSIYYDITWMSWYDLGVNVSS